MMQLSRELADLRHSFETLSSFVEAAESPRCLLRPAFIAMNSHQFGSVVSRHEDLNHTTDWLTSSTDIYAERCHVTGRGKVTAFNATNQRAERQLAVTSSPSLMQRREHGGHRSVVHHWRNMEPAENRERFNYARRDLRDDWRRNLELRERRRPFVAFRFE
jgi:hypothetical protein